MRFGQRVGAVVLDGILRGHHHERPRQRVGAVVHRDLVFIHGFQQRALGLGRGAVDFIGQHDVGKDGSRDEIQSAGVDWLKTLMPTTSEGSMSEVNCKRWKVQLKERASEWARVVLPTPGTSSISKWPRANRPTKRELDHLIFAPDDALHGLLHALEKVGSNGEVIVHFGFFHAACVSKSAPVCLDHGPKICYLD